MSSNLIQLPEGPRGKMISSVLKYGGLIVAGLIIAPIIFTAIKGIIGAAIAVGILFTLNAFGPFLATKISNLATKYFIQEIRENPVESRMNLSSQSWKRLKEMEEQLQIFRREVNNYIREVQPAMKVPGNEGKYEKAIDVFQKLLAVKMSAWAEHRAKIIEFDRVTEQEVKPNWAATLATDKLNKTAKRMKIDTALFNLINNETVRASEAGMANSMADLEHAFEITSIEQLQEAKFNQQLPTIELQRDASGMFVLPDLNTATPRQAVPLRAVA